MLPDKMDIIIINNNSTRSHTGRALISCALVGRSKRASAMDCVFFNFDHTGTGMTPATASCAGVVPLLSLVAVGEDAHACAHAHEDSLQYIQQIESCSLSSSHEKGGKVAASEHSLCNLTIGKRGLKSIYT